jgi:hypothetical protein
VHSAQQKVRINATSLLSAIFKHYPSMVENYWEMCVTSNVLSKDFLAHVKKLRISTSEVKMSAEEKLEIAQFMRSNFGEHSIILLSIFERSNRVKCNSITCLLNMISNFQGKKLIDTTESAYVEKLLKETKSSFVPKSFIIFSGLRNALYFLLFVLYYEKNLPAIVLIFRTLCELCNNCTLVDKMAFEEGVGLLLSHYIVPILDFEWTISQLDELRVLCINFLAVLVNSNRKWAEIEQRYFKSSQGNINLKLLAVLEHRRSSQESLTEDKIVSEILNYFTRLCKHYYSSIFFRSETVSVWTSLEETFAKRVHLGYTSFVEEVFKSYLDEQQQMSNPNFRGQTVPSIGLQELTDFLVGFLRTYALEVTQNNYIHLLATVTYIDYAQWSQPAFAYPRNFLLHCFHSFVDLKHPAKEYPSIESIKGNTLVRVALIKLVGYMSFCPAFQTPELTKKAVSALLDLSKQYKSFNSIVKVSWGLSNWSKVPAFASALT